MKIRYRCAFQSICNCSIFDASARRRLVTRPRVPQVCNRKPTPHHSDLNSRLYGRLYFVAKACHQLDKLRHPPIVRLDHISFSGWCREERPTLNGPSGSPQYRPANGYSPLSTVGGPILSACDTPYS
ncbi:hypothetical protein TNCV_1289521 [Trichonephila clavipes]|nr:hypothetical protein TNCV_1289521 [Trichonephila clavipes]